MDASMALLTWSKNRIVPLSVADFSVTEQTFDPTLNPIRAKVRISLRVLSVDDLGFDLKGGCLFMGCLQAKDQFAAKAAPGSSAGLGIGGVS